MENALITLDNLPVNTEVDAFFGELTKGGFSYLPRLQLCGSSTELAKTGLIPVNHYALVYSKESFDDLSKNVIIIPLRMRPKALDISNPDGPVSYYTPSKPEFRSIFERSSVKGSGCMAGPEFLVWVPDKKRFATFFFSAPTSRPEAPNMLARLGLACQMDHRIAKSKKTGNVWPIPVIKPYSSPVEPLPSENDVIQEVTKFVNEKDSDMTAVEESSETRER